MLVAHQPAYLAWCGYFSRLLDTGQLVLLDHVQFPSAATRTATTSGHPAAGRNGSRCPPPPVRTAHQRRAHLPAAWACRNCRHVGPERRGAGSMRAVEVLPDGVVEVFHRLRRGVGCVEVDAGRMTCPDCEPCLGARPGCISHPKENIHHLPPFSRNDD